MRYTSGVKRVHKALQLRHHKHTGKLLPHKHTSYGALFLLMAVPIIMLALVGQLVQASDYLVSATVPATMPTDAPTIDTPQNATTTYDDSLVVSGTCPVVSPPIVVAVYDSSALVGSASCAADGHFAVTVPLTYGEHTLVATVTTITGQVGASSAAVTVTRLQAAPGSEPSGSSSSPTGSSVSSGLSTEALGVPIHIAPTDTFVLLSGDGTGLWTGTFTGGKAPYKITIDWGDGTVDTYDVTNGDEQKFTHHYEVVGVYPIIITAVDSLGQSTTLQSVAVTVAVKQQSILDSHANNVPPIVAFIEQHGAQIYIVTLFGLGFLWYLEHGRQLAWHFILIGSRKKNKRKHRGA